MSPELRTLLALTGFEIRRGAMRQGAGLGLLIFVAAVVVGAYAYWVRNGDRGLLFGEGFLMWTMGLVAFGLAIDRRQSFDIYLVRNHIRARVYLTAKVFALIALIVLAGVVAFAVRSIATADPAGSLWSASVMTLVALMVAPLAMLVEAWADTTMPAAFVVLGYGVAGALVYATRHSAIVFELPGFAQLSPGNWASAAPLALRAAIELVPAFLIAGAAVQMTRFRPRRY